MDKLLKNPINIIADLCLIAFLLPGQAQPYPNSTDGYHVMLGLVQPGWCRMEINPPPLSNITPGVFLEASIGWIFFFVFVIAKVMALRQTGFGSDVSTEEYLKTARRPKL